MRLSVIFVITLAVSVLVSSTATWALTYTTSYSELRDMASGFVSLATSSVEDFGKLVRQLISDSGTLISSILDEEYERSMAQLNETGQQFLQTTMDLMERARNTTAQSQGLVISLVASFGSFMGSVITDFKAVGTNYASLLRMESATRTQSMFSTMLQDRVLAIQRQAYLYQLGVLNLTRRGDQPLDDESCTLLGLLCASSGELKKSLYIGTEGGNMMYCDVTGVAYALLKRRGPAYDNVSFLQWSPYIATASGANFSQWKAACIAGSSTFFGNETCSHSNEKDFPTCNATCGYDPRCRTWYTVHYDGGAPRTRMSAVYNDIQTGIPIVTLSFPIYASSSQTLMGVAATDFFFSDVNNYLATLGSGSNSQVVTVIFNSSDLLVVGSNVGCVGGSGIPIAQVCDPVLRRLGSWLVDNQGLGQNVSLELNGTLWEVFPGSVDSFSYFVAVGMNKTEVYAVVTAISEAAATTLSNMSETQTTRMTELEAAALTEMDATSARAIANLQQTQAEETRHMVALQNETAVAFNASREQSAQDLSKLINNEMEAVYSLENYHLNQVSKSIGTTFGAAIGIFAAILLLASYGTWIVTKQVQNIAQVMEDVAQMRVEQLTVSQKSPVREVQRIEAALGVLVARLAEYKSYMPAGLFQQEDKEEPCISPMSGCGEAMRKVGSPISPHHTGCSTPNSVSTSNTSRATPVVGTTRLLRRSVVVMAVNIVRFQGEMAQRSASHLEGMLNRLISAVHGLASKSQGNIDAIVGDQVLVTFSAHFMCSDPPNAAATVALELKMTLQGESTFPGRVQIGLAAGSVFVGHLGYTPFKAMVALGPPMKVASLLSHLSGFHESVVLVCPSVEERIKYHFTLQPADLVSLPALGEHSMLYSKSATVFSLEAACGGREVDEWLYQINTAGSTGRWAEVFIEVTKAPSTEKARADLEGYLAERPEDLLAQRLLSRLPFWQPQTGIVLAERPDIPHTAALALRSPSALQLSLSVRSFKS